jgi:hypothetical protein
MICTRAVIGLVLPYAAPSRRSGAAAPDSPVASHADPRTTMRYDRARTSLDRHAIYIVAAYIAGAAR